MYLFVQNLVMRYQYKIGLFDSELEFILNSFTILKIQVYNMLRFVQK